MKTAGIIEREKNQAILDASMAAISLSLAYQESVLIEYSTTREIDAVTARLDEQYQVVLVSGASQEVKNSVTDMRVKVLSALDDVRVDTSQIISVTVLPTTSRLLAFNYYGNDDNGGIITDLNSISDVSFVEGDVEVITS